MAMTRVLLACIATCILCSLLLKPANADGKHIDYGAIGGDRGYCKGGKCSETPANTAHKPCVKEQGCRGPQSRRLTEEQVDDEDKEKVLQVDNADSDANEPNEEFFDRDIVVLGH
ncbi:hypothetical protein ACHQM5_025601 [Ranunculus cassubicifolius]